MRKVLFMFGQLRDEDVDWLGSRGSIATVSPAETLIHQGQDIASMYILLDGEMAVNVQTIGKIAELQPGEVIGEMSFVSSLLPFADVVATSTCKLFVIDRQVLKEHLERDLEFSARFYRSIAMYLADRLRGTVQRLGHGVGLADASGTDEADDNVLDGLYIAGLRFERLLGTLATRSGG